MNFAKTSYAGNVEILATDIFQAVPVTVTGDALVKAGTVVEPETGVKGILLYDVDPAKNPNGAAVVQGIIDAKKAQAHAGVTYSAEDKAAMPGIVFRTNIETQE